MKDASESQPGSPLPEPKAVPLAIGMLALAVGFAPLAFGATEVWSAAIVQGLAGLSALGWLAGGAGRLRWLWVPAAVAALGLVQVAPVPEGVLATLSPFAHQKWAEAREASGLGSLARLSLAPANTLAALRDGLLFSLVVAMLADLARRAKAAQWMAGCLAGVGLIVLLLGLATWPFRGGPLLGFHDMRGPLKSYKSPLLAPVHSAGFGYAERVEVGGVSYLVSSWNVGDTFGPFVVSNHYGGCLELTIPLAVALLGCGAKGRMGFWRRAIRRLLAALVAAAAVVTVAVGAKSWAGTAGLLLGLAWVCWQASAGRWRRVCLGVFALGLTAWIIAFVLAVRYDVAGLVGRAALPEPVEKLADSLQKSARGRWEMWRLCGRMWADAPWTGLGLGAFADAYPHYAAAQRAAGAGKEPVRPLGFAHADYLQFAAEAGLAGVLLAAGFVTVAARHLGRNRRRALAGPPRALAIGLGGALIAFLPHGLFDWNLHVPANALLLAVAVGTLLGVSGAEVGPAPLARPRRPAVRDAVAVATIAAIGICLWGTMRDLSAHQAAEPLRLALFAQRMPGVTPAQRQAALEATLAGALWAAEVCPQSPEYAELAGRAYLHLSLGAEAGELAAAERWFCRALAQAPLRADLRRTLAELRHATRECQEHARAAELRTAVHQHLP